MAVAPSEVKQVEPGTPLQSDALAQEREHMPQTQLRSPQSASLPHVFSQLVWLSPCGPGFESGLQAVTAISPSVINKPLASAERNTFMAHPLR